MCCVDGFVGCYIVIVLCKQRCCNHSPETIFWAENVQKCMGGRGFAPDPAGGAYSAPHVTTFRTDRWQLFTLWTCRQLDVASSCVGVKGYLDFRGWREGKGWGGEEDQGWGGMGKGRREKEGMKGRVGKGRRWEEKERGGKEREGKGPTRTNLSNPALV